MRTAFKIFKRDLKRILVNPVAVIVAIGVCIIPSLYAWFNILANWDPYENTSTVPIAVVIEDKGAEVGSLGEINAGDMMREQLEENTQLGWTFVDDEDEAIDGVKAGTYYAAFVVPEDFTSSLSDVLDGDTEQAHIAYYVNEKVNAISPKVTDTGSTTLETEIANKFVSVVGKTITEKLQGLSGDAAADINEAVDSVTADLTDVQGLISNLSGNLSSAQDTIQSARDAVSSARSTLSKVSSSSTSLSAALNESLGTLSTTRTQSQQLGAQLSSALGTGISTVSGISSQANYEIGQITGNIGWAQGQLDGAISTVSALNSNTMADVKTSLDRAWVSVNNLDDSAIPNKAEILKALENASAAVTELSNYNSGKIQGLKDASDTIKATNDAVKGISTSVNDAIQSSSSSMSSLQETLSSSTIPALSNSLDSFASAGGKLAGTAEALPSMLSQADGTLAQLDSMLAQSASSIQSTADSISAAADKVGQLASDTAAIQTAENFQVIKGILGLDAEKVGEFVGSPVEMVSQPIYPVENYGSGVAPFYTNLALWVGGFVLVAIYKLEVDDEGIGKFKPWQGFFGRWLLMNLLGQVQALICCIGDIALGIQCLNPVAFVFAGMVESFVYVFFIYAISVAFKHIGKAIGVLLVILQIPGASGTYPIEMMPGFFQNLHPWLPFTYGINAMREAIAGFYGNYYAHNLLVLALFLVPSLLIGVTARRHLLNVNALFDRKLGDTDLMITERTSLEGAHFRLSTIVKVIMNSGEYKELFLSRTAKFELMYPMLVKRGFAALVWVPLVLLGLLFVLPAKFAMLMLWIVSLVVICTFLIVIEYFHERIGRKLSLAEMSREELYDLLDDELREEFMAFAPFDKMRLDRAENGEPHAGLTRPLDRLRELRDQRRGGGVVDEADGLDVAPEDAETVEFPEMDLDADVSFGAPADESAADVTRVATESDAAQTARLAVEQATERQKTAHDAADEAVAHQKAAEAALRQKAADAAYYEAMARQKEAQATYLDAMERQKAADAAYADALKKAEELEAKLKAATEGTQTDDDAPKGGEA